MNITAKFWDRAAQGFDWQEARYQQLHSKNVKNTQKYLHTDDLVLDYGCATGTKTIELAGYVRAIQGIDISPKMIAAAKRNAVARKIQNVEFRQATIFDKQVKPESLDTILAFGILHLLKNLPQVLHRINHLLKSDGWFISSTACMGENETIPTLMNRLLFIPVRLGLLPTLQFLRISNLEQAITRAGFQIIETETIPFNPNESPTYIVSHFIAARKYRGILEKINDRSFC